MKTNFFLLFMSIGFVINTLGQSNTLELTFTAVDNNAYVQVESIKVSNLSNGSDTVLFWPDTVLLMDYQVGTPELLNEKDVFQVFPNYPNPIINKTNLSFYIPEKGEVNMFITDVLGRQLINIKRVFDKGHHNLSFSPGVGELFVFTAIWKSNSRSIKILSTNNNSDYEPSLEYIGLTNSESGLKSIGDINNFTYTLDDDLLCIAYADDIETAFVSNPQSSENYIFQFAINIPCPDMPTVTYEGQVYNTIQIRSQCWFKENLNYEVGNSWYYNNNSTNGDIFGRLYDWGTAMNACPEGWHIPSDAEWKVLEGVADTQYGIGHPEWDGEWGRGYDAGTRLKSSTGWLQDYGTDNFGFSGLPGGMKEGDSFRHLNDTGYWWSSTSTASNAGAEMRVLYYMAADVTRYGLFKGQGISVRCLKD